MLSSIFPTEELGVQNIMHEKVNQTWAYCWNEIKVIFKNSHWPVILMSCLKPICSYTIIFKRLFPHHPWGKSIGALSFFIVVAPR